MLLRWVFWLIATLTVAISLVIIIDKKTAHGALSCLEYEDTELN
jgi:hypothetical protein